MSLVEFLDVKRFFEGTIHALYLPVGSRKDDKAGQAMCDIPLLTRLGKEMLGGSLVIDEWVIWSARILFEEKKKAVNY